MHHVPWHLLLAIYGLAYLSVELVRGQDEKKSLPQRAIDALPAGAITRLGIPELRENKRGWASVHFLPDGRTVAATTARNNRLVFWDARTGKEIRSLPGHRVVMFSPDGKKFASKDGNNDVIRVFDLGTEKEIARFPCGRGNKFFAFSPDGQLLAVGGGNENRQDEAPLRLWEVATGKKVREFAVREMINVIAFSPDGKSLAISKSVWGESPGQVLDVASAKELWHFFEKERSPSALVFSPGGEFLLSAGDFPPVCVRDALSGKELWRIWTLGPDGSVDGAFSPNGQMIAVSMAKGTIYLFEAATGRQRGRFDGAGDNIYSVAFSPCGSLLASVCDDCAPLLWDVTGRIRGAGAPVQRLGAKELDALWGDLQRQDAAKAWQAICALATHREQAVQLLKERLPADPKRLARLLADLDSEEFATREAAFSELAKTGPAAVTPLKRLSAGAPSAEAKRAAEALLAQIGNSGLVSEEMLYRRRLEVLEYIATPGARQLLRAEAQVEPPSEATSAAKATLDRLNKRPPAP